MSVLQGAGTVRVSGQEFTLLGTAITNSHGGGSGGGTGVIPPLNTLGSIGLNTLQSINPDPGQLQSYEAHGGYGQMLGAWNSGVFSPDYGTLGATIVFGGGDNDYWGNQISVFPYDDETWEARPLSGPSLRASDAGYVTADHTRGLWDDGSPGMPHTYDAAFYLPPAFGGGSKGSVCLPITTFWYLQNGSTYSHLCDINTGAWTLGSVNGCSTRNESMWCFDTARGQGVGMQTTSSEIDVLLILAFSGGVGTHSDKAIFPTVQLNHDGVCEYIPSLDMVMTYSQFTSDHYGVGPVFGFYCFDRTNDDTGIILNVTGDTLLQCAGAGMAWVPDYGARGAIFMLSSNSADAQFLWRIEPPAVGVAWQTGIWTVTKIDMGAIPSGGVTTNGIWKRLRYNKAIGCLCWVISTSGLMNLYAVTAPAGRTASLVKTLGNATVNSTGSNGTNFVTYSADLIPFNDPNFSTLSHGKHMSGCLLPDGKFYIFPKDCSSISVPGNISGAVDGNQEIYTLDPSNDTWLVAQPYYVHDNTLLQGSNPDDAWIIAKGDEFFYFFSQTTASGNTFYSPPDGSYATPINNNTTVAAYLPASLGGNPTYGTWRVAFGSNFNWHADRAWRGWIDVENNAFVTPMNVGGQTGFLITDATSGADLTDYDGSLPWSFGPNTCSVSGCAVDLATRTVYLFDVDHANICSVNMDNVYNHSRVPVNPVINCAPFTGPLGTQYTGKICWHDALRAVCMPVINFWFVYRPDLGTMTSFPRQDGRISDWSADPVTGAPVSTPGAGPWVPMQDTLYDAPRQDVITYGAIDFNAPGNASFIAGFYRNHFRLA